MQEWNFAEIIVDHVPVPLYPYGTGTAVLVRVQYCAYLLVLTVPVHACALEMVRRVQYNIDSCSAAY